MTLPDFLTQTADGEVRLADHRVGLFHLIQYYNEGYGPEMLVCQYPSLPLALVHKVIAWYLENQEEADRYLAACQAELNCQRGTGKHLDPISLRRRLEAVRQASPSSQAESA